MMITVLRLSQIQDRIHRALVLNFSEPVWIRAEVAQSRLNRGHYYLQLVEKADGSDERIAQIDAVLWSSRSRGFPDALKKELSTILEEGMEIQVLVRVDYHAIYGLKLNVEDIELTVAEGRLALHRQQIIQQIKEMGLFDRNRHLPFPLVIQRVAVITSLQAAGWQDFREHLQNNAYGYTFQLDIFPAAMQGASVEQEVIKQLNTIRDRADEFDVCVIIRGGGSKLDLAWFDNQSIGEAIARSGIPVLTGIGHDIDETVSDLVAARALKTPTAVASFILETNLTVDSQLLSLRQAIIQTMDNRLRQSASQLDRVVITLNHTMHQTWDRTGWVLDQFMKEIRMNITQRLKEQELSLDQLVRQVGQLDPAAILSRGFSMTTYQDKPVRDPAEVPAGSRLKTFVEKGIVYSNTQSDE